MNNDQLDDLKQFVADTVKQTELSLKTELKSGLDELRGEMNEGFTGVGEAVERIHDEIDDLKQTDSELGQRVTALEAKTT